MNCQKVKTNSQRVVMTSENCQFDSLFEFSVVFSTGKSPHDADKSISYLLSMNAKLLIPWLLADERPHDLCEMWPTDCPLATLQVTAKFSFVYSVPRGVFERLSCRCHQHSSYIRHWRSGLLTQYGCVKMFAHTDDNEHQVTMTARAPDAGLNMYRLFHVLWRCVSEMENVLVTLPGVLLNRYQEGCPFQSRSTKENVPCGLFWS